MAKDPVWETAHSFSLSFKNGCQAKEQMSRSVCEKTTKSLECFKPTWFMESEMVHEMEVESSEMDSDLDGPQAEGAGPFSRYPCSEMVWSC